MVPGELTFENLCKADGGAVQVDAELEVRGGFGTTHNEKTDLLVAHELVLNVCVCGGSAHGEGQHNTFVDTHTHSLSHTHTLTHIYTHIHTCINAYTPGAYLSVGFCRAD